MTDLFLSIILIAIVTQIIFLLHAYSNYRYAVSKYNSDRGYMPKTVVIVPCKGLDPEFHNNITSLFLQDYENYLLWFVVEAESDPAYEQLCKLKEQLSSKSKALEIKIFIAGIGKGCSQKIHNLLYCYERIGEDIEVLAFADSDVCVRKTWLSHIVWPLRKEKHGAASGYRWFVPNKNNPATLGLSAMNAKVAQLLGNTAFNQAWGGSMAIRVEVFRRVGLDKIWPKALSDDLSLSHAVKKAGLKIVFVPACLVASYETTTLLKLIEFGRRQFLITKVAAPLTWWFGLLSCLFSVLGLWGGIALIIYSLKHSEIFRPLEFFIIVTWPLFYLLSQTARAIMRQMMINKLLSQDREKMRIARITDILFSWLWSLLLLISILTSAFGRTIRWRGVRYKLLGPTETVIIDG